MRRFSRTRPEAQPTPPTPFLPTSLPNQTYVRVAPLDGGQYTKPAALFVDPPDQSDPDAVVTVPSLPFIIQHPRTNRFNRHGEYIKPCNILFDRGLRPDFTGYSASTQMEIEHRRPIRFPDPINKQLSRQGLSMQDIDLVVLSHLHWSHTGDASDFSDLGVSYLVGPGTDVARNEITQSQAHRIDSNMNLPRHRTIQLPHPGFKGAYSSDTTKTGSLQMEWKPLGPLPATLDLFGDGSVYVVDLPGHTQGHIGMLCRCGPAQWAFLVGDLVHDLRLLTGEREIATWRDGVGRERCIHENKTTTKVTIGWIRTLLNGQIAGGYQLEIVPSHDMGWVMRNLDKFWPNSLFHRDWVRYEP